MRVVKLGVVGAGGMGLNFALRCTKFNEARVIAIADVPEVCKAYKALAEGKLDDFLNYRPYLRRWVAEPRIAKALEILGKQLDPSKIYSDYHELADDPDVEGVYVATPNIYHAPVSIAMLNAGKHVLCEKPMATCVAECEKMVKAAKNSGKILQIGFQNRFSEDAQFVRSLISSGLLGRVYKTKSYGIHVNSGPGGWFTKKRLAGGGALIDMGVHAIDMTRFLLGEPKAEKVYAKVETRFGNYDVDDFAVVMIEFENGCTSIVEAGWWNTYSDGPEAATQVFGEKGYARIYPVEVRMRLGGKWGVYKPSLPDSDPYEREIKHFIECIILNKPTDVPGEAGLEAQRIIDAAYKSSKLGVAVKV